MRFRSIIVTLCAVTTSCVPSAQDVQDNDQHKGSGADHAETEHESSGSEVVQYPPDSHIRLADVESALQNLLGDESAKIAAEQEQREKADLEAQQQMARWAFWMLWLTAGGLLIGIFGTILIWRTLKETQNASKAANTTLDMTAQALEDARRHARLELTPTVTLTNFKMTFMGPNRQDEYGDAIGIMPSENIIDELEIGIFEVKATADVKNWGQTPVYNYKISGSATLLNEPSDRHSGPRLDDVDYGYIMGDVGMIAPGESTTIDLKINIHHRVTPEMLGDMQSEDYFIPFDRIFVFLDGKASFWDVFSEAEDKLETEPRYQFFYHAWPFVGKTHGGMRFYPIEMFNAKYGDGGEEDAE